MVKKYHPNHEGKLAYSDALADCTDFLSFKTSVIYLGEHLGVQVDRSTKCYPEVAGEGILGAKHNQCREELCWQIRRERRKNFCNLVL
jgi:hypothetical protein